MVFIVFIVKSFNFFLFLLYNHLSFCCFYCYLLLNHLSFYCFYCIIIWVFIVFIFIYWKKARLFKSLKAIVKSFKFLLFLHLKYYCFFKKNIFFFLKGVSLYAFIGVFIGLPGVFICSPFFIRSFLSFFFLSFVFVFISSLCLL